MMMRLCALMLLLTGNLAWGACDHPWRVGFDNWPPYHYYLKPGESVQGFAAAVLQGTARQMGCSVQFVERPWKRTLQLVASGDLDVAMEAAFTDERARYAYFSAAYNPGGTLLWVKASDRHSDSTLSRWLEQGRRLGTTRDFFYGDAVMSELARYPGLVSPLVSEQQNYGKLLRGRIDGFLGDALVTHWGLQQQGLAQQIVPLATRVSAMPSHFMLSRKHFDPAFVTDFNAALAAFLRSAEYDALLRRYAPAVIHPLSTPSPAVQG